MASTKYQVSSEFSACQKHACVLNQNYSEGPPHTSQNGRHLKKSTNLTNTREGIEKRKPSYTVGGNVN